MVKVSAKTKEQARGYRHALGEKARPKWTSLEIKSKILEIKSRSQELMVRDRQKGLRVKAEVEQKCREKGLAVRKNDTKGSLIREIRSAQGFEKKGSDETIVGFGRRADKKYKDVPQTHLDWVMEVFRENPTVCQGKWARLATWVMAQ